MERGLPSFITTLITSPERVQIPSSSTSPPQFSRTVFLFCNFIITFCQALTHLGRSYFTPSPSTSDFGELVTLIPIVTRMCGPATLIATMQGPIRGFDPDSRPLLVITSGGPRTVYLRESWLCW